MDKDKFSDKKSLLDFLKKHWGNGEPMDEANFHMTWDVIVRNLRFDDGVNPDVAVTDNEDGTHTITITNYDGTTTSSTIHDGKNGTNGKDGLNGTDGKDGFSPEISITDNNDGTHTISITQPDGTTKSTVIHDGKNGVNGQDGEDGAKGDKGDKGEPGFSPEATITDGTDGTHTLTITKPDGTTVSTVIHDGKNGVNGQDGEDGAKGDKGEPGFSPEVTITDGTDGTHTITISKPDGTTASTVIHDGKNGTNGKDGLNGTDGKDGFSPKISIADNNDGTHTITISKPDGTTASTVIHDGKNGVNGQDGAKGDKGDKGDKGEPGFSPEVTITDGTDGTHTLTITKPGGSTSTVIKDGKNGVNGQDGKDGADGKQGEPGKDGFSPEVTITDGAGTHTLTITKPGGSTSTVIKDGKDGKDGTPGISYAHPLDKNSMAVMASSHTYYPLYQTDNFDASSPFYKFTPDIKVEVNGVAADAPKGSIGAELADAGWTKGLAPTSYVITMFSNNIPNLDSLVDGNFTFNGGMKGEQVVPTTLDVPIDSLKLPTADGASKSIADIGFISSAPSFDKQPMFFMTYPRPFLIPVSVVEKDAGGHREDIQNETAIVAITPNENFLYQVPVISHEGEQGWVAKFSPSRKSISELPNVFKYSWAVGTVHIPFYVHLLQWDETKVNFDRHYSIQSDSCKTVEVYPIFDSTSSTQAADDSDFVKSIVLNSAGREVMKLFIGDPNNLGLINF